MDLHYHSHFRPSNDVVFGVMFGKQSLFCKLIHAVTDNEIILEGDPHAQAQLQEDDVLLNYIRFDTFAETPDRRLYSADIERRYKKAKLERRTVYYACRAISTQDVDDMAYDEVKPVHISFIMTSHKDNRPVRHIKLCDSDTHEIFDDLIALTLIYVPTVLKTEPKNSGLYIFAKFFNINTPAKAKEFAKRYRDHELGKELIMSYNNALAKVNELQAIEQRPYFLGRLTEAQLAEERKKAEIKGEIKGERKGKLEAAQKMLSRGVIPEQISDYLDLDIKTIHSLKPKTVN